MPRGEFTKHQQGIIKRYYDNQSTILLQKLGELVTDLYLADGKKRDRLWKSAESMLDKLKVPAKRIAHVVKQNDIAILAKLVQELQASEPK